MMLAGYKSSATLDILDLNVNALAVRPAQDNAWSCGSSGLRWTVVYATTGAINTSDSEAKTEVQPLSDKETAVARRLKGLMRTFKFKDAVAKKGDGARIHCGCVAQDVEAAFLAEGLDPHAYGVFCSDTQEDGTITYGIRYDELFAFIIAGL
jgi:hypothetical protein